MKSRETGDAIKRCLSPVLVPMAKQRRQNH